MKQALRTAAVIVTIVSAGMSAWRAQPRQQPPKGSRSCSTAKI